MAVLVGEPVGQVLGRAAVAARLEHARQQLLGRLAGLEVEQLVLLARQHEPRLELQQRRDEHEELGGRPRGRARRAPRGSRGSSTRRRPARPRAGRPPRAGRASAAGRTGPEKTSRSSSSSATVTPRHRSGAGRPTRRDAGRGERAVDAAHGRRRPAQRRATASRRDLRQARRRRAAPTVKPPAHARLKRRRRSRGRGRCARRRGLSSARRAPTARRAGRRRDHDDDRQRPSALSGNCRTHERRRRRGQPGARDGAAPAAVG